MANQVIKSGQVGHFKGSKIHFRNSLVSKMLQPSRSSYAPSSFALLLCLCSFFACAPAFPALPLLLGLRCTSTKWYKTQVKNSILKGILTFLAHLNILCTRKIQFFSAPSSCQYANFIFNALSFSKEILKVQHSTIWSPRKKYLILQKTFLDKELQFHAWLLYFKPFCLQVCYVSDYHCFVSSSSCVCQAFMRPFCESCLT